MMMTIEDQVRRAVNMAFTVGKEEAITALLAILAKQ